MLTSFFVYLGITIAGIGFLALIYRLTQFLCIVFFGKNYNVTYIDKAGVRHTKKITVDSDDDLVALIKEIKANAKGSNL